MATSITGSNLHPPLSSSNLSVEGRNFVITGGTQGLGLEIARQLKQHGASGLVLVARSPDKGQQASQELSSDKCCCKFVQADLGEAQQAATVIERALQVLQEGLEDSNVLLSGLVNAAATTARGTLMEETAEGFDSHMAINVRAPFLLTQAFAKHVQAQSSSAKATASIVNICSVAAHGGAPFIMGYSASKAALVNMVKTHAAELAPLGIRCNGINMGQCFTDNEDQLQRQASSDWLEQADARVPLGRILRPKDSAMAALFLLSDASAMITASILDLHPDFAHGIIRLKDN